MNFLIDVVRLSQSDKDSLIKIKRKTGVDSWNVLCRWSLTIALAQSNAVYTKTLEKRDSIEIKWDTFAGKYEPFYLGLLQICYLKYTRRHSELSPNEFFHSALSKGISILFRKVSQLGVFAFTDPNVFEDNS